jgi:hypothetical protein
MSPGAATVVALALASATALGACAGGNSSSYDERFSTNALRAGQAAPTFNCQDRGTCGGPTAIPGTGATDSPGPRGNGRQ